MAHDEETIQAVWEKGATTSDPTKWRKDQCGAWIYSAAYGKTSDYGWEIDHITPLSQGGKDILSNMRPLHWQNNRRTSDGRLACKVKASGEKNIEIK